MLGIWLLCVCSKQWGYMQKFSFLHWTSPSERKTTYQCYLSGKKKCINISYIYTTLELLWWKRPYVFRHYMLTFVSLGNIFQVCAKTMTAGKTVSAALETAAEFCFWDSMLRQKWKQIWWRKKQTYHE